MLQVGVVSLVKSYLARKSALCPENTPSKVSPLSVVGKFVAGGMNPLCHDLLIFCTRLKGDCFTARAAICPKIHATLGGPKAFYRSVLLP